MSAQPTVVILAGGENSRFFPLNTHTHKGALTVLGKPLIVRTLENIAAHGFSHVVIVVSPKDHDGKGLSGFLSNFETKLHIEFVLQPQAKGMGDALLCAKEKITGDFGVVFPSSLDGGEVLQKLVKAGGDGGAIAVSYTQEPWLYGIVTLDTDRVTSIVEKPSRGTEDSNLKAQGIYFLSHVFLKELSSVKQEEYAFETALDQFLKIKTVKAVELTTVLPPLKYPWHLFEFQRVLFQTLQSYTSPSAVVAQTASIDTASGPVYIGDGATIGHCAHIVGPAYIGEHVFIGDFSLVRASSFEKGSSVGVHSDVTRSIICEHSTMHNGFLGDSIVGRNVRIGAGLITSNKRMDRKNIQVVVKDARIDCGTNALGTVIGDEAKIGIRVNIMPGKFIGCRSVIYPGQTIWDHVPHDQIQK